MRPSAYNLGVGQMAGLNSERGQMAIFIALIFQVLFVFFAVTVNVGMLVHQKINLQNSVDLAAYYAAQRQAEILNAIAHTNYQIHQSWKLLAWRLRAVGDLGRKNTAHGTPTTAQFGENHPAFRLPVGATLPEAIWLGNPFICTALGRWQSDSPAINRGGENLCYSPNFAVPGIPTPNVGPVRFLSFVGPLLAFTRNMQRIQRLDCEDAGPANFSIAARWLLSYREAVRRRKITISRLANNLSGRPPPAFGVPGGPGDFVDLTGESVRKGAFNTFERNLTRPNRAGSKVVGRGENFEMLNSLALPQAAGQPQPGGSGEMGFPNWLNDRTVWPLIYYTDFVSLVVGGSDCRGVQKPLIFPQGKPANYDRMRLFYDPSGTLLARLNEVDDPLTSSSLGVEKNPWFMAYVGIRAKVKVSLPFSPFGEPVELEARAFAKPFGGTVGPWSYLKWPRESFGSTGTAAEKVDVLAPNGMISGDPQSVTFGSNSFPNFSRFPGDTLGLSSQRSLASLRPALVIQRAPLARTFWENQPPATPANADVVDTADHLAFSNLPRDNPSGDGPWIRKYEIAAIAPNYFDAMYYSIEPNFDRSYIGKDRLNRFALRRDFGFDPRLPQQEFGVLDQVEVAGERNGIYLGEVAGSENNFYTIRGQGDGSWARVLTGWIPNGAFRYLDPTNPEEFPRGSDQDPRFGRCAQRTRTQLPSVGIPGSCAQGGRTGYSVKIISRDYLLSDRHELGGSGMVGSLLNPPPNF